MKKNLWKTIALSGLLVGSLDIIAALVQFYSKTGKDPLIVLKYIASAVVGKEAFSGGNPMAIVGLLLHFVIAFAWTIFFFWIYPKLKLQTMNRVLTGVLYGIFIWLIMTRIIVPMTKVTTSGFDWKQAGIAASILIAAIGLPLSFIAARYYRKHNFGYTK